MKAKDIAKKCKVYGFPQKGDNIEWGKMYEFAPEELQDYADALCEEQRKKCVESWEWSPDDTLKEHNAILNAPQPEAL